MSLCVRELGMGQVPTTLSLDLPNDKGVYCREQLTDMVGRKCYLDATSMSKYITSGLAKWVCVVDDSQKRQKDCNKPTDFNDKLNVDTAQ